MKRIAIIDVGSNSARLVIMEIHASNACNLVYNQKDPLRLALKTDKKGYLTEEAFAATTNCLKNFASMCRIFQADEIIAVATAAIRNAPNGAKLAKAASQASGINLEIISGKTEAYLSYLGVINTIDVKDAVIFDLGGASTEVILVKDRKLVDSVSLPIGCVNLTKNFKLNNAADPVALNKMRRAINDQMQKAPWIAGCGLSLVGVGGTARSIGKIEQKRTKYFTSKLHNYQFGIQDPAGHHPGHPAPDSRPVQRSGGRDHRRFLHHQSSGGPEQDPEADCFRLRAPGRAVLPIPPRTYGPAPNHPQHPGNRPRKHDPSLFSR